MRTYGGDLAILLVGGPMQTLEQAFVCRQTHIRITTSRPSQFVDLTAGLADLIAKTGLEVGFVNLRSADRSTAIAVSGRRPLLRRCASIDVAAGRLVLDRSQRVFLVELDGPHERDLAALIVGECRP